MSYKDARKLKSGDTITLKRTNTRLIIDRVVVQKTAVVIYTINGTTHRHEDVRRPDED